MTRAAICHPVAHSQLRLIIYDDDCSDETQQHSRSKAFHPRLLQLTDWKAVQRGALGVGLARKKNSTAPGNGSASCSAEYGGVGSQKCAAKTRKQTQGRANGPWVASQSLEMRPACLASSPGFGAQALASKPPETAVSASPACSTKEGCQLLLEQPHLQPIPQEEVVSSC